MTIIRIFWCKKSSPWTWFWIIRTRESIEKRPMYIKGSHWCKKVHLLFWIMLFPNDNAFLSLLRRKAKFRNTLSQNCLESDIRCELCTNESDFCTWHGTKIVEHHNTSIVAYFCFVWKLYFFWIMTNFGIYKSIGFTYLRVRERHQAWLDGTVKQTFLSFVSLAIVSFVQQLNFKALIAFGYALTHKKYNVLCL